ncbi:unnamed protein product [Durusdinium trenchii]|uniref:K Homology domain-containing protein n=2 Tax=Durusdinium trenchii TaxID=1381693 RepID=A0ABP0KQ66_9DINO
MLPAIWDLRISKTERLHSDARSRSTGAEPSARLHRDPLTVRPETTDATPAEAISPRRCPTGRSAMKRPFDGPIGAIGGALGGGPPKAPRTVGMAIKMLVTAKEAGLLIGKGGMTQKQIAETTGCKLHLSGINEHYPQTSLQELSIKADTSEMVANGVLAVLGKLSEETGKILGGEWEVEEGGARVHFIVPTQGARNIIGRGGENVKMLREASMMKVHVEDQIMGLGDAAEQVISLAGPLQNMQIALPMILEKVEELATQPFFANWAFSCLAATGAGVKGTLGKGKGMAMDGFKGGDAFKGKGKGKDMGGMGMGGMGMGGMGMGGMDFGKGKGKGKDEFASYGGGAANTQANIDMLSQAVSALPSSLGPDRSQQILFNCAAGYVSALIGKAGAGTKQIAMMTDTKIMIREIEGNPNERSVVIKGNVINVAAAYLHLASRLANVMQTVSPDAPPMS